MKRVKLVVAYDGTAYCGWQFQVNGITIEEVLNKALSDLLGEPVAVTGASRTDSGVHAEGNVAVFETENRMPADKICFAVNQRLPADIRVLSSEEVALDWHPRRQNCKKTYEYRILNRKIDIPTRRLYSHFCYAPLDVEKMREAAAYLVGEHDFKSFCSLRGQAEETVRTIYQLEVNRDGDMITLRISGSGFLYNMVRIIAGTLMKVGMGVYPPEHVEEILDARDRNAAGPKAPARGLTLISLEYEKELEPVITGENKYWKYELIQAEVTPKGKAYLIIWRCVDEEFEKLLSRVTHQAVRNGADFVYACEFEKKNRILPEKRYGYYQYHLEHRMLDMRKPVDLQLEVHHDRGLVFKPLEAKAVLDYCDLYNRLFFSVPNSSTMTEQGLRERLEHSHEHLLWILTKKKETAGFVMLIEKEDGSLEIDAIGILEEFQGHGLAKETFARAEKFAADKGIKDLSLLVSDINLPAYTLYRKLGFMTDKVRSDWYVTEKQENRKKKQEKTVISREKEVDTLG